MNISERKYEWERLRIFQNVPPVRKTSIHSHITFIELIHSRFSNANEQELQTVTKMPVIRIDSQLLNIS